MVGILIAFLVLLIGFGSVIAGILPLISAIAGVAVTNLALLALTAVVSQSSTTSILATMIGLAVGIDYSLFVLNRHRQQLVEGADVAESIGRAVATSGSAVCFAGTTVLIALAALSIVNIPFLTVMGLAAAGAVVVAVLAAITLVPALLGFAGMRLLSSHWARRKVEKASAPGYEPWSWRYVTTLKRAPILVVLAGIIMLLVVATPFFHMRLGLPDAGSQPTSQTTRRAYDLISEGFGPGANGPLLVVVYSPGGITPAQKDAFTKFYSEQKAHLPTDVASIGPPIPNPAGNVLLVEVTPKTGPNDPATTRLIDNIRAVVAVGKTEVRPGHLRHRSDRPQRRHLGQALLGLAGVPGDHHPALPRPARPRLPLDPGPPYRGDRLRRERPGRPGRRHLRVPAGASGRRFGIARPGPVLSFLPIILLGILFGLAMDYEVFLESRMREESRHKDATQR